MNKFSALATILLLASSAFAAEVTVTAPEIIRTGAAEITLHGTATASTKVTWQTSNGATGTATGTERWQAASIPVTEGNTTVIVKAYDASGASSWVAVVAVRQPAAEPVVISSAALPKHF